MCEDWKKSYETKVMKISWQLSPVEIMVGHKQPENVEYFNYCNSIIFEWRQHEVLGYVL